MTMVEPSVRVQVVVVGNEPSIGQVAEMSKPMISTDEYDDMKFTHQ